MARLKNVYLSCELVAELCVGSMWPGVWARRDGGLPEGSRCVGMHTDPMYNRIVATFEHESFSDVPDGCAIPWTAGPQWSQLHCGWLVDEMAAGRLTAAVLAETLKVPVLTPASLTPEELAKLKAQWDELNAGARVKRLEYHELVGRSPLAAGAAQLDVLESIERATADLCAKFDLRYIEPPKVPLLGYSSSYAEMADARGMPHPLGDSPDAPHIVGG